MKRKSTTDLEAIRNGARLLREGGLVVFPTETVYGLGADARNDAACRKVFAAKGRPADNPLIVHIASVETLPEIAAGEPPVAARRALEAFSPGPITVVVRHNGTLAPTATTGLPTVALRIPEHPVALALLRAAAIPIAAPSANRSGRPSPTSYAMAMDAMEGRVDAIIDGGDCSVGVESTILDCTVTPQRILRPGGVTFEMLREAGIDVEPPEHHAEGAAGMGPRGSENGGGAAHFRAPGSRYRHYTPSAPVYTVEPDEGSLPELLHKLRDKVGVIGTAEELDRLFPGSLPAGTVVRRFDDLQEYARGIYRSFYDFDREGCTAIVALLPAAGGVGTALRDRLGRAGTPFRR